MASAPTELPVTERYRAVILSFGGVLAAGLLALSEAQVAGRPLGGVEVIAVGVAVLTSLGVYYPANPWAKFAAGLAGAVGQALVSGWTDGRFTQAEAVTIGIMALSALGIGAFPNAPALVVAEPGPDVSDRQVFDDAGAGEARTILIGAVTLATGLLLFAFVVLVLAATGLDLRIV